MFCSTIIPTIGRPSLARSVQSVLDQTDAGGFATGGFATGGEIEVIVVNDSGQPLPPGDWQASPRVRLIETSGRCGQSVARNAGAAIAQGRYLHFLDDDDWLLPGALAAFWELSQRSPRADWLYGGVRMVNGAGQTLGEFNPGLDGNIHTQLMAGAWITPVASLIRTEAFVGTTGFDASMLICEETDLGRRLTLSGDVAHTRACVVCVLRADGAHTSTANMSKAAENNRWSRDRALAAPGALGRMLASAHNAYWRGRILQAYLAAAQWNLKRGQYANSARRGAYAVLSLMLAGPSVLSGAYWQALADEHVPLSAFKVIGAN